MSAISIAHNQVGHDCVVVQAEGELDFGSLRAFRTALAFALAAGPSVVVDLRRARFLSLRNAWALAESVDTAVRGRIEITVLAGRPEIERVLELAGIRALSEIPAQ
ncbi:STAS domain-containing protein [Nocardia sp. NPDC020380]|uniref:STAS domain-containing protein n=1 Tax=Nocardia sp. NPDC020380 TaxID=3364309 RepID=UPI0037AF16DA